MHLNSEFISQVLPQFFLMGSFPQHPAFSVDSRTLQPGEIFIALQGSNVDGHEFIDQALKQQAGGFVLNLDKKEFLLKKYQKEFADKVILFVPDTLDSFVKLAHAWRMQFNYPVVAITGTVGKTSTKEMVHNVLKESKLQFIVSSGNQNTLVGVSINIFKMHAQHHVAVFELGIGKIGSMRPLVELLKPTTAVVTYVGHGHLEGLKSLQQVAVEKRAIFSMFTQSNIGIVNGDQPELADVSYPHPVIKFGKKLKNQIQARRVTCHNNQIQFTAKMYQKKYNVTLATCNEASVYHALAALAVGYVLQIPDEVMIRGISKPLSVKGRFQVLSNASNKSLMIHDGYNSNPESVRASLQAFENYQTPLKKVVVLGDMKELGDQSVFWHRQLGRKLTKLSNIDAVVLIGDAVSWTKKSLPLGMKSYLFASIDHAESLLKSMMQEQNKIFLFKASNSMRFCELIEKLQKQA